MLGAGTAPKRLGPAYEEGETGRPSDGAAGLEALGSLNVDLDRLQFVNRQPKNASM